MLFHYFLLFLLIKTAKQMTVGHESEGNKNLWTELYKIANNFDFYTPTMKEEKEVDYDLLLKMEKIDPDLQSLSEKIAFPLETSHEEGQPLIKLSQIEDQDKKSNIQASFLQNIRNFSVRKLSIIGQSSNWASSLYERYRTKIEDHPKLGANLRDLSAKIHGATNGNENFDEKFIEEIQGEVMEILDQIPEPKESENREILRKKFEQKSIFDLMIEGIKLIFEAIREEKHNIGAKIGEKLYYFVEFVAKMPIQAALLLGFYESDARLFASSDFKKIVEQGVLNLPAQTVLPNSQMSVNYHYIGDSAFPLETWLLKPFSGNNLPVEKRIYNYRLSRARRTIENTFGIMSAKWRLLQRPIETNSMNATNIVKAITCLHNFLIDETEQYQLNPCRMADNQDENNGRWRGEVINQLPPAQMQPAHSSKNKKDADQMRQNMMNWFNGPGTVQWQYQKI